MQPDESSSRTLDSLPPRPPTPPRDSQSHVPASKPSLFNRLFSKSLGAQTPPNLSPGSAAGPGSSPSERATRRVAWSASTVYRDHEEPSKHPKGINPNLRLIPSSVDRPLPPISILKQNNGVAVDRHIDFHIQPHEHTPETFATMLESVTKQLAGDDRLSRIDAYMSLSGVLKATDAIPDEEALRNKMGLLAQFIQRDMEARQADGEVDKVLVNNALALLASLLWKNEQLPQEFAVFVLEHTITSFENKTVPKDIAKHLMFIIGQQNFSPKIVTSDRATRLLIATYMIQESYEGKSIALGRLSIYKKLLQQAKPVMLANTTWLKHVLEDMLHPDKNVRAPYLAFGLEVALLLGVEKHGSRAFIKLFDSNYDGEVKYADYYHTRLLRMLQAKGEHATLEKSAVPRIWSTLILFLRYKPAQLDKWPHWTTYLHVLQKCFNSSDQEVKAQANLAWNRLVFSLQPDAAEEKRKLDRQLLQPFLGQLHAKRKHVGKSSREMFQITVSSACNLLYYALRPSASAASLDLLWDLYVPPLIQQLSDTDSSEEEQKTGAASCEGSNQAIAILQALLNPTPRAKQPWRIDRAMSDERMRFDELSPIDSKWVRSNSQRVLAVLQPLIRRRFKDLSAEESRLKDLWKGFLLSIHAAGSKEVITSHETMSCIAHVYTMAHTIWQKRPCHDVITQEGQSTAFLDGFVYLLIEMVEVLGMLPFGEKRLSVEDLSPFAVVATPSTSSRKTSKSAKTAVQCLISLLVAPGANIESNFALKGALRTLLAPFHQFRLKNKTDLEFCKELFEVLPSLQADFNMGAAEAVWCVVAKFMLESPEAYAETRHSNSSSNGGQLLGVAFRDKVRVLEYGLALLHHDSVSEWQELSTHISMMVTEVVGAGGLALAVTEPLARALIEYYKPEESRSYIRLYDYIIQEASYPPTEQSLEAARRKLWGVSTRAFPPAIDPFKHLYTAINFYLTKAYELGGSSVEVSSMLEHTGRFIRHCPHALHENLLQTISEGLALWFQDADGVINSADSHSSLKDALEDLWSDVRSAVDTRVGYNDLAKLKTILAAALSSRHKYIVSSAIELWNELFGVLESIEYPDEVAQALARLRSSANLLVPNFPDIADNEIPPATISFLDSDDSEPLDTGGPRGRCLTPSVLSSSPFKTRSSPVVTLGLPRSSNNHQHLEVPPMGSARKKVVKRDTTPRLRHDNSQIKFAAIEASPERADAESQLLTDRQREIRERQEQENRAMFADLRSSPKPREKKEKKSLSLSTDKQGAQAAEGEHMATPSVTSAVRTLDDWVTSSPTPQSRKKKHVQVEDDLPEVQEETIEIPSSPPKAPARSSATPAESRTPSPPTKPADDIEMAGTNSVLGEVPSFHPPGPSDVNSPPSFANLVNHVASESVQNSSPAVPAANLSLSKMTKVSSKRRRSPEKKASTKPTAEDDRDEDQAMEEAQPIALSSPTTTAAEFEPAPQHGPVKEIDARSTSEKSPQNRSRSKTSKSSRKSQEHHRTDLGTSRSQRQASTAPSSAQPENERRRSSSLSELDESMVKSLEATHSVDDDGKVRYIELKPQSNFSPEQYAKVDVFSSPVQTSEFEAPRKETRIVPPARSSALKGKPSVKKGDKKATSESTTIRTTRGAEKRKSSTPSVTETPVTTPMRASSRLRHVEPPEVVDLEKVDPSLGRSSGKMSRSQRKAALAGSVKKATVAEIKGDGNEKAAEVWEGPHAVRGAGGKFVSRTPNKSHAADGRFASETASQTLKKDADEDTEVQASPSVMEFWLRKETPVPVPTRKRKRKSSHQAQSEPEPAAAEEAAVVETGAKSSRNKRRKKDEKRLQTQVVEDSQQQLSMEVEHEGITVPPLSQSEKPEKSNSSSTFRTAKSATVIQPSKVESESTGSKKKGKKRGKNGRGLSAADRSVVESSQQAEEEEYAARTREEVVDEAMPDVEPEPVSQRGDAKDDAISIASSHLEVEETAETTIVRYDGRRGQVQREVSKSKSPSRSRSKTPQAAATQPDNNMAEAEVEAQLQSSIRIASVEAEAGTPNKATNLMEALTKIQQERDRGQSPVRGSTIWLHTHNLGPEVIPSSSPAGGHERVVTNSSELGYMNESLPSKEIEHVTYSNVSSGHPSSEKQQHFTSSPPRQFTQEEQQVLDDARASQRKRSRAASAPPSQLQRALQQRLLEKAEAAETEAARVAEAAVAKAAQVEQDDDSSDFEDEDSKSSSSKPDLFPQQLSQQLSVVAEQQAKNAVQEAVSSLKITHQEPTMFSSAPVSSSAPKSCDVEGKMNEEEEEELTYENISVVFQHGIEMLNRCEKGFRRHHVAKMEEMMFDIKAAMYNAERRSREGLSEEERIAEFGRL